MSYRLSALVVAALAVVAPSFGATSADTPRASDDTVAASPSAGSNAGTAPLHDALKGELYDINDLRLIAGFLPTSTNGTGDLDHNYRLAVQWMRAPYPLQDFGGLIWGIEGAFNNGSKSVPGDRLSYYGLMGDIMVGWAWKIPQLPNVHLEGTPLLGIGFDRYHDTFGGSPSSFTYEYGLRVAGYYTFENLWQVGADLRYLQTHSKPEFGGSVGGLNIKTTGFGILFGVGRRF